MTTARSPHPGRLLKQRFLDPLGISPYRLAKSIGVHVRRVSELVKGNRCLTPDTAMRLGLFFGVPALWWLEMQARYDAWDESRLEDLRGLVQPYEGLADVLVSPNGVRRLPADGEKPKPATMLMAVPDDVLERLRAQAAHAPPRTPRQVHTVTHPNGSIALVGPER